MINPTPQYDDRTGDQSRDFASAGKFSLYALERMLKDCAEQPMWRMRAKVCAAYYDGKQFTEMQRLGIRQEDLEERAINLIRPVINSVLGQEAKSRTDVKIEADKDDYTDVAAVLSERLKEAERETRAHMAVSEGYASGVKKGLGWVHVSRNSDPQAYAYRVEAVPLDEIWWDWRGQRGPTLLDGCRWLVRQRMADLDELEAAMPEHRKVLRMSASGWENMLDQDGTMLGRPDDINVMGAYDSETRFNLVVNKHDWLDAARKMIKLYEIWYRVPAMGAWLRMGPTKWVEYNPKDPRHIEAVSRGLVKIKKAPTSQVRRALYAGPYRLLDEATKKRNFPYFPFFAFRDDDDKSPYGLIDGMIAPQDEYNERRLRIQWMLKARQVQMDSDALDTKFNDIPEIVENAMRPDLVAITNPHRTNKGGPAITIKNELSMQKEQFEVMADSKQLIQDTAGRYSSQLGNAQVQSGVANSLLIEQGEQSMGEMNDNYTYFRRSVFECLVEEIVEDYKDPNLQCSVGTGQTARVVVLNAWDPAGMPVNQVADAEIKTGLAETPNTPAFRAQTQQQLATIIQALGNNPKATAVLAPAYIESTTLVDRKEVANDLRRIEGLPLPGDKEGQAQAQAQQQAAVAQQQANQQAEAEALVDDKKASAERARAAARASNATAALLERRMQAGTDLSLERATVAKTVTDAQLNEAKAGQVVFDAANEDTLINDALAEALG